MKKLILTVESRMQYAKAVQLVLPDVEIVLSQHLSVHDDFIEMLKVAGEDALLAFEDDIQVSSKFADIAYPFIASRPSNIISFFSLKTPAGHIHARPIADFCMTQCFYLPKGFAAEIVRYYPYWPGLGKYSGAQDFLIRDAAIACGIKKYWLHEPNLVQHLSIPSIINPKRSKFRQSKCFLP